MMTIEIVKRELIEAHRANDWERARALSQEKQKLKKKPHCQICGRPLKFALGFPNERCSMHQRDRVSMKARHWLTACLFVFSCANAQVAPLATTFIGTTAYRGDTIFGANTNQQIEVRSAGNIVMHAPSKGTQYISMRRADASTWTSITFADESELATNSSAYVGMGPDYANGGYFWVPVFDGFKGWDLFQVGKGNSHVPGRFAMGASFLYPHVQLGLADVDTNISLTFNVYSTSNSIRTSSRSLNADAITIDRLGMPGLQALCFHQGNGTHDWRIGFDPQSYDLVFYNVCGGDSSPANPGRVVLRLKSDGTISCPSIDQLTNRIAVLEGQIRGLLRQSNQNSTAQ